MPTKRVQHVVAVLRGQKLEREAAERREANRRAEATRPRAAVAAPRGNPRAATACPKPGAAAPRPAAADPGPDAVQAYEATIAGLVAAGDAHPGRTVAAKYPHLHAAYLRAVNARPGGAPRGR